MAQEIWTEKYRPKSLEDVIGHTAIKRTFEWYIKNGDMPNVLLYGKPGVGKTALAHAFGREMFGSYYHQNFRELNASDDRGINVVRTDIKDFAEYAPDGDYAFKILYLGEIDGLTKDAQDALKRTIEVSHDTVRFMADCNNVNALIPAILSRFVRIYAKPLPMRMIKYQIHNIVMEEELDKQINSEAVDYIIKAADGDMRQALQILQALPYDGDPITEEFVMELVPSVRAGLVAKLVTQIASEKNHQIEEQLIQQIIDESGYNARPILQQMYDMIWKKPTDNLYLKSNLLETIGEYLYRVTQPCDQMIQLRCCISQMQTIMGVA